MSYTGRCGCGGIRYIANGDPIAPHLCHCRMCQRLVGAPVVAWVGFPSASLVFTGVELARYRSSEKTERGFCPICGSALSARDDGSETIDVTIATLDDPNAIVPEFESFRESAPTWSTMRVAQTGDR